MSRSRVILFLGAGILSCAFPLLRASWELNPLAVRAGWLVLGCLIGLGTPLRPPELLLLAMLLTPGLFTTLATHADLNTTQSYISVFRVMLVLGLYTALTGLSELSGSTTVQLLLRFCLILVVPLLFVLGLERAGPLVSAALAALAWAVLLFLRSLRNRG
jgi:hypothetical protein